MRPRSTPPIALILAIFSSLTLFAWLWHRSQSTFHFWASPFTIEKHDRILIATGYGDLYLAHGWPSTGPTKSGLPISEPIFGSEAYEGEPINLEPGEATQLATQQFSTKIDGVPHTDSFPIARLHLSILLLPALIGTAPRLLSLRRQARR